MSSILDEMEDKFWVDYTDNPSGTNEAPTISQIHQRMPDATASPANSFDASVGVFPDPIHISVKKLSMKESIFDEIDEIESNALYMLERNDILSEITNRIGTMVREIICRDDRIGISLYSDIELPDWNDFTISVKVKNKTFDDRIGLWRKIEGEVQLILDEMKVASPQDITEIESIDRNLTVIVEEF